MDSLIPEGRRPKTGRFFAKLYGPPAARVSSDFNREL